MAITNFINNQSESLSLLNLTSSTVDLWKDATHNLRNVSAYINRTNNPLSGRLAVYSGTKGELTPFQNMTNGQLIIGSTSGSVAPGNLIGGPGIAITNGPNSITITNTGVIGTLLVDVVALTSLTPAIFTPTFGAKFQLIRAVAGGGGGGGAPIVAESEISGGSGGGAGGFFEVIIPSQSFTYQCGAGGAGGNGSTAGGDGDSTVIILEPPLTNLLALGGVGGISGGGASFSLGGGVGGSFDGVGSNGFGLIGMNGSNAIGSAASISISGAGGNSAFGNGGNSHTRVGADGTVANGNNAVGYGAGGGGALASNNTDTAYVGGNGAPGYILVYEFG